MYFIGGDSSAECGDSGRVSVQVIIDVFSAYHQLGCLKELH